MTHWFVRWLELQAKDRLERAQFYREAIKGETKKARNLLEAYEGEEGIKEMLEEADEFEEVGLRYAEWARGAEDMIECGMEEQIIQYYDARQSLGEPGLFLRLTKLNWTSYSIGEQLEEEIESTKSDDRRKSLEEIDETISGLYSVGLKEQLIEFYQRKRAQYPELDLPEPIIHEEFDEEERATGRIKNLKHWFIEWLTDQADTATDETEGKYRYWVMIADDMIQLGMEQAALDYYDARREEQGLLPRPHKVTEWSLEEVLPVLEKRIQSATDTKDVRVLQELHTSIRELLDVDMRPVAVSLYLRHYRKHLELNLPELKMSVRDM